MVTAGASSHGHHLAGADPLDHQPSNPGLQAAPTEDSTARHSYDLLQGGASALLALQDFSSEGGNFDGNSMGSSDSDLSDGEQVNRVARAADCDWGRFGCG